MDPSVARSIAIGLHTDQRDADGRLVVERLSTLAAAMPEEAAAAAWLHDAIGDPRLNAAELRAAGLTVSELEALELLLRTPSESYELHALRIAHADGEAGHIARLVALADIDDHLSHDDPHAGGPPDLWARRHIAAAEARRWSDGAAHATA
jgi:hypothetical protein